MITCYTGTPGSGKSLHSIKRILAYLKAGRNVIANFPLCLNKLTVKELKGRYFYVSNQKITVDYLYQFAQLFHVPDEENQTLLIIDEASVKFNCRTYSNNDRLEFLSFFSQHRKMGFDIVLVTQNLRQLDRQIRDQIEMEIVHRKLNNFSIFHMLPFALFVAIERNKAVNNEKNNSDFFLYNKRMGSLYDTYYDFTRTEKFIGSEELRHEVLTSEITRSDIT